MGAVLCCMRPTSVEHEQPEDDQLISNCSQCVSPAISSTKLHVISANRTDNRSHLDLDTPENKYRMIGCMTLGDCLSASPSLNPHNHMGGEIQIFKQSPRKFCPPSLEASPDFFTPRMSFAADSLGFIDGTYEYEDNLSANTMTKSASRKLGKQVSRKIFQSSPEVGQAQEFFTPRMSVSANRLGVAIEETYEYEENLSANPMSRSASGKLGKKVRFRLPEEADMYLYYTLED